MRALVAIASYGTANDRYLAEVLAQYRALPYKTRIVVLSNLPKRLGSDVEVIVGLPTRNPWSLPHAHKPVFAAAAHDFDLFIYSEDDHLITKRNIEAFLEVTTVLPENKIAGFLVSETDRTGNLSFPGIHGPFHWDPFSVKQNGSYVFASFTNEHSASYLLTQSQLLRAISSGGFLVPPHSGKYDLPCSAATDVYTQCGFQKVICISHLQDFTLSHLPNKYLGRLGINGSELDSQISELLAISRGARLPFRLLNPEPAEGDGKWAKQYYEEPRADVASLVPRRARKVLSVGCGWGATENLLMERGISVVGLPIDSVIAKSAETRGVKIISSDLMSMRERLSGYEFDCILCLSVLHLVPNPEMVLDCLTGLLSEEGIAIVEVPNCDQLPILWNRVTKGTRFRSPGTDSADRTHLTTRRVVFDWFRRSRLRVQHIVPTGRRRARLLNRLTAGAVRRYFEPNILVVGASITLADP